MTNLQVFKNDVFGNVRIIEENNKVLFCGSDVAKALGYSNVRDAILKHCRCVVKRDTPHPQSKTKTLELSFITEGDLYRLITHSKLPEAEKFESWVFDEVLPTIRKHGTYMTPEVIEKTILNPDFIINIATQLKEEQSKRLLAESKVAEQQTTIDVLTHKFLELKDRKLLTTLVRKIAGKTNNNYSVCFHKLYDVLLSRCGINLKVRQKNSKSKTKVENISEKEWQSVVPVTVAWFLRSGGTTKDLNDILIVELDEISA